MNLAGLGSALRRWRYAIEDGDRYRRPRFRALEVRWYEVDADFPALVTAALAGGELDPRIQNVSYTLDLSGEPPVPLTAEQTGALLDAMARVT